MLLTMTGSGVVDPVRLFLCALSFLYVPVPSNASTRVARALRDNGECARDEITANRLATPPLVVLSGSYNARDDC